MALVREEVLKVFKDWKRMCSEMQEMNGCEDCPIKKNLTRDAHCGSMPSEIDAMEAVIREIMNWAENNPEPRYPTWVEWLVDQGVLQSKLPVPNITSVAYYAGYNANRVIPKEMVNKLKIDKVSNKR